MHNRLDYDRVRREKKETKKRKLTWCVGVMEAIQPRVVDELEDDGSNMSLMSCFSDSDTIES